MFFEPARTKFGEAPAARLSAAVRAACVDAVLLALLFASPFIRRSAGAADGKKITVVAVDQSFSMRAGNRLAQAKDEALKVVDNLKPGDQAQVIALRRDVQALTQADHRSAQLRAAVTSIQPGDSRASFGELARYARPCPNRVKMPHRPASGERFAENRRCRRVLPICA